jgi:sulfur carrier protein
VIRVNGEPSTVRPDETLTELLGRLGLAGAPRGVAVAVDGEVVPRAQWETFALLEGARVEILSAMQGG